MKENIKKQSGEVSRRDFLIGTGAVMVSGAIGTGMLGCAEPEITTVTNTITNNVTKTVTSELTSMSILNPVGKLGVEIFSPSPRLDTLDGKRVALYVARRANAYTVMARLAENLKAQFKDITVLGGVEGTVWAKPSYDREGDIDSLMAENPDAVIMALSS